MDIDGFNRLADDAAAEALLACCALPGWARAVAAGRPYADGAALAAAGDAVLDDLDWNGVRQALDAHPRLGERRDGGGRDAAWSRGEQSAVTAGAELAAANTAYEERFGYVLLVCATGLTTEDVLAQARRRLTNDPAVERVEATRALRAIVVLRLEKLVAA